MLIDLTSDIHLDMYDRDIYGTTDGFKRMTDMLMGKHSSPADVLVIAGDLGHYDHQNINFLEHALTIWKHIVIVWGNHDYYVIPGYHNPHIKDSVERIATMKTLIASKGLSDRIHPLENSYWEYEGKKVYGLTGWYDGSYAIKHFNYNDVRVNNLWKAILNDSRLIRGMNRFDDKYLEELRILRENPPTKVDLVVSHVNPSIRRSHHKKIYRHDIATCFYAFDGKEWLNKLQPSNWVFGHCHLPIKYKVDNTTFQSNPLGYPFERTEREVKKILIGG